MVYADAEKKVSVVSVYLDSKPAEAQIKALRKSDCGNLWITRLRREDWAESWKKHFHPLEIGGALLIKPSWSKRRARRGQAVVILDPGLSFGTGQHPTTEYCLRQIVAHRKPNEQQSFLDVGAGSGILVIAAAKLGYAPVEAFDFDAEAVRVARANAKKNRVDKRISLSRQDLTKLGRRAWPKFDLICANLISNLLIEQREKILLRLKRSGVLVLAGILKKEFAQVKQAYEYAGLKLISSRAEKEWRSGAFRLFGGRSSTTP